MVAGISLVFITYQIGHDPFQCSILPYNDRSISEKILLLLSTCGAITLPSSVRTHACDIKFSVHFISNSNAAGHSSAQFWNLWAFDFPLIPVIRRLCFVVSTYFVPEIVSVIYGHSVYILRYRLLLVRTLSFYEKIFYFL